MVLKTDWKLVDNFKSYGLLKMSRFFMKSDKIGHGQFL